jgi:hypothetical protein
MKQLINNKFASVFYFEDTKLYKTTWTEKTSDMTELEMKTEIETTAKLLVEYKPLYFLADDSKREYIYNVESQKWVANTLANACIMAGVKKFAIIMPLDFITELSTEQTAEEAPELPFRLKFFKSEQEAMEWLFS